MGAGSMLMGVDRDGEGGREGGRGTGACETDQGVDQNVLV